MSLLRLTISLCFISIIIIVEADAAPQADQTGQAMQQHPLMTPVDGAKNPEKIPDYMKYHIFFTEYVLGFRNQLSAHITPSDDKILSDAVAGLEGWHIQERTRYLNAIQELCFKPVTEGYIARVQKSQHLAAETNRRTGKHYRSLIQSLSMQGREAVESLVSTEITPNVTTSLFDADRWFADDPEGAKEEFEIGCFVAVNGYYPPDVQAIIDENRKIGEQRAQQLLEEEVRKARANNEN